MKIFSIELGYELLEPSRLVSWLPAAISLAHVLGPGSVGREISLSLAVWPDVLITFLIVRTRQRFPQFCRASREVRRLTSYKNMQVVFHARRPVPHLHYRAVAYKLVAEQIQRQQSRISFKHLRIDSRQIIVAYIQVLQKPQLFNPRERFGVRQFIPRQI